MIGGLVGIGAMIRTRKARGLTIPYGPWLIAGAWLGILAGPSIGRSYLDFVMDGLS